MQARWREHKALGLGTVTTRECSLGSFNQQGLLSANFYFMDLMLEKCCFMEQITLSNYTFLILNQNQDNNEGRMTRTFGSQVMSI